MADVADALNTVQDSALDLAVEQAVLRRNIADSFVNLGRRNQNLLGRQLDFITELETNETDPDTLSNLFRLDHLATRMRRNAESLLVLAGIEPPRQWAAPVRLTDVIRAALGEVEDYQRVTVRGVEPATIIGSAAADLAHLLAELIENALVFSPPDQTVDIRGARTGDGPTGGYTLAIIDAGPRHAGRGHRRANRRLAGAETSPSPRPSTSGHYVAGNLAARHGIRVHLDNSPGSGITATLNLPPTLLTTDQVTSAPVTPPHGQRAVRAPLAPEPPVALPAPPAAEPWGAAPAPPRPAPFAPAPWDTTPPGPARPRHRRPRPTRGRRAPQPRTPRRLRHSRRCRRRRWRCPPPPRRPSSTPWSSGPQAPPPAVPAAPARRPPAPPAAARRGPQAAAGPGLAPPADSHRAAGRPAAPASHHRADQTLLQALAAPCRRHPRRRRRHVRHSPTPPLRRSCRGRASPPRRRSSSLVRPRSPRPTRSPAGCPGPSSPTPR